MLAVQVRHDQLLPPYDPEVRDHDSRHRRPEDTECRQHCQESDGLRQHPPRLDQDPDDADEHQASAHGEVARHETRDIHPIRKPILCYVLEDLAREEPAAGEESSGAAGGGVVCGLQVLEEHEWVPVYDAVGEDLEGGGGCEDPD